jgi:hypothetical protein
MIRLVLCSSRLLESPEIGSGEECLESDACNEPDASRGSNPMGLVEYDQYIVTLTGRPVDSRKSNPIHLQSKR